MIQYLRSITFYLLYSTSGMLAGIVSIFLWPLPFMARYNIVMLWNTFALWAAKHVAGIDYHISGLDNLPKDTPYVVLCKHQSTWETVFTQIYFKPLSTILKKELLRIPFFGWGLALLKPIAIDRSKPREAMRIVHKQGVSRLKEGINVLVFPEGTRIKAGETGNYARSGAEIARAAGVPIVPVAHNAGFFWPVPRLLKSPGCVQVVIGKPVSTEGRNSKELTAEIKDWIEGQLADMPTYHKPPIPDKSSSHGIRQQ